MKRFLLISLLGVITTLIPLASTAQQYSSMSGLIHTPSADMCPAGEARIGVHYLNKGMLPDEYNFEGNKYNTGTAYLSITPFSWIEVGYTFTLMKGYKVDLQHPEEPRKSGFYHKDRHLSVKLRPIKEKEGKWWPSIAVGSDDPVNSSGSDGSRYFRNYYAAATKHFDIKRHLIGVHVSYRRWERDSNHKWNGVVGGITYQPSFQQNLRFIAEYTGNEVNIGFDWKLWKHLLIQSSLQDGKYFSGGLCFCINLL